MRGAGKQVGPVPIELTKGGAHENFNKGVVRGSLDAVLG